MANWGGLNAALTAWRNDINRLLPGRDIRTDGARADKAHGSTSQHQEDADGTVDAFDQDINVLKSSVSTGSPAEDRIVEALKRDFESDPHGRGQLWIEDRQIANADIGDWQVRAYDGDSPHTEHIHWQSRQSREHIGAAWPMPHTEALLREMGMGEGEEMLVKKGDTGELVRYWQHVFTELGLGTILGAVDGVYGDKMSAAVNAYRRSVDSSLGQINYLSGWQAWHMQRAWFVKYAGRNGAPGLPGAPGRDGKDGRDGTFSGALEITGGTLTAKGLEG